MRDDKNHKVGVADKITYCTIFVRSDLHFESQKVEWQVDGSKMVIQGIAVIFGQHVCDSGKMC